MAKGKPLEGWQDINATQRPSKALKGQVAKAAKGTPAPTVLSPSTYSPPADIRKVAATLRDDVRAAYLEQAAKVGATSVADLQAKSTNLQDAAEIAEATGSVSGSGKRAGVSPTGSGETATRALEGLDSADVKARFKQVLTDAGFPEKSVNEFLTKLTKGTDLDAAARFRAFAARGMGENKHMLRRTMNVLLGASGSADLPLEAEVDQVASNLSRLLDRPGAGGRPSGVGDFVRNVKPFGDTVPIDVLASVTRGTMAAGGVTSQSMGPAYGKRLKALKDIYGESIHVSQYEAAANNFRRLGEALVKPNVTKVEASVSKVLQEAEEHATRTAMGITGDVAKLEAEAKGTLDAARKAGLRGSVAKGVQDVKGLMSKASKVLSPEQFEALSASVSPELEGTASQLLKAHLVGVTNKKALSDQLDTTIGKKASREFMRGDIDAASREAIKFDLKTKARAASAIANTNRGILREHIEKVGGTRAAQAFDQRGVGSRVGYEIGGAEVASVAARQTGWAAGVKNFLSEVATQTLKHPIREAGLGLAIGAGIEGVSYGAEAASAGVRAAIRSVAGNTEERQLELAYKSVGDPALAARLELARQQTDTYRAIRDTALSNSGYITPQMLRGIYDQGAQTPQSAQTPRGGQSGGLGLGSELH